MNKIRVCGADLAISRLGFGCARVFGGSELSQSAALIEAAIRHGIAHFDTASAYGSEDVLGAVIGNDRTITIATKVGLSRYQPPSSKAKRALGTLYRRRLRPLLATMPAIKSMLMQIPMRGRPPSGRPAVPAARALLRDEVHRELEESLRRLRRTWIDLYLLHEPDGILITEELRDVFDTLRKDGVIKAYGLAYGAIANESIAFGTVLQGRFPGNQPSRQREDCTRIYHGIVRFGFADHPDDARKIGAGALIARAIGAHPQATAVFSASTGRQIRQIANAFRSS
ncbi:MAG TPA: aldo/keto reductase [Candidatus Binataceae bacterium]|nr:aldo/keto reductase [Candidatus Binataceae bacterium]